MQNSNPFSRRAFLDRGFKISMGVALSTLLDVPLVVRRALAEGNIGLNGKKVLFIFLRGANDGLNSVVPILDSAYAASRPNIGIAADAIDYSTKGPADFITTGANPTFGYRNAIRLGNGFAALHPSLKFLAPVYNQGRLALIHRVGYPKQSRSHFDSQNYWETGNPNNNLAKDGIFYRTMIESGLANRSPLTGVSVQSSLPLILRGSKAAMTNLTDPNRYSLLGIPDGDPATAKAEAALRRANGYPFAEKRNRDLLSLQYENLSNTLQIFGGLDFSEAGNIFTDDVNTDGDFPYYLFPTTNVKNGGYSRPGGGTDVAKYVVNTGSTGFFNNLKSAALILNKTDAIVAGTQMDGFDTHQTQGGATGTHANLQSQIGWSIYALQKYFTKYADKANWNNLVVVTLSEFGRTTVENSDAGTDHAEAGVMFVAGGGLNGGVYNCGPNDPVPWVTGSGATGTMFGVSGRYLKRCTDYRSVLGELIRNHLGATQDQLGRIIPGYNIAGENLMSGGVSSADKTQITGELGIF
jgi:uncharacterized protein (DUF1501 family)